LKIVAISDTHGLHHQLPLPPGDVLIHAGDVSRRGDKNDVLDFLAWFEKQPFAHKIFVAGNHDFFFEREKPLAIKKIIPKSVTYLNDSGIQVGPLHIWGSPITPWFFGWAFNRRRGEAIRKHWNLIPANTHILITHGPPATLLDRTKRNEQVGCEQLEIKVREIKPPLHIFGHIHEAYGETEREGTQFINASSVNEHYQLMNPPVVFEL
jgi:Icc-related predicted phosphoesterase